MFRPILIIIGLLLAVEFSAQTCSGNYNWIANGNAISFIGTTSPGVTNFVWDFGDGVFDYSNNITTSHAYANPGTYQACIQVYDSLNACADSTCHMIVIDSCYGSFTYTTNGLTGNFFGYANGGSPNTVYAWNFGDNTTTSQQNPSHTFANAGTYTVCFAYYDLVTGCADSVCMPVYFAGCIADFSYVDSMGYVFFISTSSLGNAGTYIWNFGDTSTSSQQYPSHVYADTGTYLVCLTVYDSAQNFCDSTCHYVTVGNVSSVFENLNSLSTMRISPNPSDAYADISFWMQQSGIVEISFFDISGRAIGNFGKEQFSAGKQTKQISTQGFSPGTYFVQLNSNGQLLNGRMIVTH